VTPVTPVTQVLITLYKKIFQKIFPIGDVEIFVSHVSQELCSPDKYRAECCDTSVTPIFNIHLTTLK